ncbi:hypothetical protein BDW68DRAFT_108848 [Aspergillus falconensis]
MCGTQDRGRFSNSLCSPCFPCRRVCINPLIFEKSDLCIPDGLTDSNCPVSSQSNGTSHNHEQALERQIETLEYYRTFLARLLDFVSHGEPETVDRLFQFIRSGASQEQIFDTLVELRAAAGSGETESMG